ncbi:MAG TPA: zinc finger Ran-binding domain-containing protein [Gemmatimonadaceae bacterium]|nr:zinc finger Ran-binding domain-containing protein [Gemmatimonadaceae bacterium]
MSKAKTNALDALRALIAERQQYEQWMATLDAKREGTPEHVFERVQADYRSRLDRVVTDIRSHAEELQLSISTLSSRLVEVARDEDTRREGLQEAELRAAVGEYEPDQWHQIKTEAESALEKIAADRASLDSQLGELRSIQKLSEMGPGVSTESASPQLVDIAVPSPEPSREPETRPAEIRVEPAAEESAPAASLGHRSGTAAAGRPTQEPIAAAPPPQPEPVSEPVGDASLEPVASAASAAAAAASKPRSMKSPTGGVSAVRSRSEAARPDAAKTLKCPECGTANYPTEWYCERCGGELATM